MKDKILTIIQQHPGIRKREISSDLHVWQCNSEFLRAMHDLENAGLIYAFTYKDPANMEFFDKWYLTNEGKRAILTVD